MEAEIQLIARGGQAAAGVLQAEQEFSSGRSLESSLEVSSAPATFELHFFECGH